MITLLKIQLAIAGIAAGPGVGSSLNGCKNARIAQRSHFRCPDYYPGKSSTVGGISEVPTAY